MNRFHSLRIALQTIGTAALAYCATAAIAQTPVTPPATVDMVVNTDAPGPVIDRPS